MTAPQGLTKLFLHRKKKINKIALPVKQRPNIPTTFNYAQYAPISYIPYIFPVASLLYVLQLKALD